MILLFSNRLSVMIRISNTSRICQFRNSVYLNFGNEKNHNLNLKILASHCTHAIMRVNLFESSNGRRFFLCNNVEKMTSSV